MRDDRDEFIDRVVDELRALPPVPADATARVLARVDAARRSGGAAASDLDDDVIYFPATTDELRVVPGGAGSQPAGGPRQGRGFGRRFVVSLPAAIGYALAATLAGFLVRGAMPRPAGAPNGEADVATRGANSAPGGAGPALIAVSSGTSRAAQEVPVPVQFVLDARRASNVAVVGDFNGWDASATPLARDSASGVWSAVVPVPPGRHVYAFLVDGRTWTLDPRAPRAKDPDYGSEQSVMIVGVQ